ncbi:MAG: hypothetical protein KDB50_10245 [Mycobacterium sp.]|nr:hypothetical protein [Mycobacterium sp.]
MCKVLEAAGLTTRRAYGGQEALDAVAASSVDAIVLDLMMLAHQGRKGFTTQHGVGSRGKEAIAREPVRRGCPRCDPPSEGGAYRCRQGRRRRRTGNARPRCGPSRS